MCDISVKKENKKFNFRVALVPYKDGKILVQNSVKDGYLSLVGGRVKLNETTIEAVKRETEEELGFELDASKLSLIKVYLFINLTGKNVKILILLKLKIRQTLKQIGLIFLL